MKKSSIVVVEGKSVAVTNLSRVLYPATGFTKGNVLDYYINIAPVLLPHLEGRSVTLKRYPDGVDGFFFYERHCPDHRPTWVKTAGVRKSDGSRVCYCILDSLPALVWAANLANLELHTFQHKASAPTRPTVLAFDLDPGPPAGILLCSEIALVLRGLFASLDMETFAKTSGSKGLQVYVPLNTPTTYLKTKAFAHAVAEALQRILPDKVVSRMQKSLRQGKVLVDWSQNDDHKTTVSAYSLRAKEHPTVSTPLQWDEVKQATKARSPKVLTFGIADVMKRVQKMGDLFAPVLSLKQKLPPLAEISNLPERLN